MNETITLTQWVNLAGYLAHLFWEDIFPLLEGVFVGAILCGFHKREERAKLRQGLRNLKIWAHVIRFSILPLSRRDRKFRKAAQWN